MSSDRSMRVGWGWVGRGAGMEKKPQDSSHTCAPGKLGGDQSGLKGIIIITFKICMLCWVLEHEGSSFLTIDGTQAPSFGAQRLSHWTTREIP